MTKAVYAQRQKCAIIVEPGAHAQASFPQLAINGRKNALKHLFVHGYFYQFHHSLQKFEHAMVTRGKILLTLVILCFVSSSAAMGLTFLAFN